MTFSNIEKMVQDGTRPRPQLNIVSMSPMSFHELLIHLNTIIHIEYNRHGVYLRNIDRFFDWKNFLQHRENGPGWNSTKPMWLMEVRGKEQVLVDTRWISGMNE